MMSTSMPQQPIHVASGEQKITRCRLVAKTTLCEEDERGEPVRRFVFQSPPDHPMASDAALRQVIVLNALGVRRMYSPTSSPCRTDGTFELVLRVYRHGYVSRWLDAKLVGETVDMTFPWPSPLPLDRRNPGQHVGLIAFGIGITELYRTAVQELADANVGEVVLLYATRTLAEQGILADELAVLVKSEPHRFRLEQLVSRESVPGMHHGRIDSQLLEKVFPWSQHDRDTTGVRFMVAGTKQMMQTTHRHLEKLGYRPDVYKLIRDLKIPAAHGVSKL
ncbi:CBR1 [Symbiodinium sp. CCMP2592]|nr:CBR1 [Symbiodinium sp. CCMP2592]